MLTWGTLGLIREQVAAAHPCFVRAHPDYRLTVYGEQSRFGRPTLERERVVFKQLPYDVRARG